MHALIIDNLLYSHTGASLKIVPVFTANLNLRIVYQLYQKKKDVLMLVLSFKDLLSSVVLKLVLPLSRSRNWTGVNWEPDKWGGGKAINVLYKPPTLASLHAMQIR